MLWGMSYCLDGLAYELLSEGFGVSVLQELIDHHMALGSSVTIKPVAFGSSTTINHMA